MNTSKKIISLLMCMLMVLTMVPMSVFATEATEIGTIHIEGIPAPVYGQTVKEYNTVMHNGSMDGTHKINGSTRVDNSGHINYGNIELVEWDYYNSEKSSYFTFTEVLPSVYYFVQWLEPAAGYKFPNDVVVTVDGAVSVETELDEDGCLTVWAKFDVAAPTEIDTVHIEGVPAPVYGQTIKSYYEAIEAKITDGTITVNDEVYDSTAYKYGNLLDDGWNVRTEADGYLSSTSTESIKEGTYYVAMWFLPDNGYVIPEDVNVIFDGAKSVKIEVEDDGCLDIHAEYEVEAPAPTEIDTVHIEGIPAPVYGQTVKEYNTVMQNGSIDGTHKINGSTRVDIAEGIFYGNIELVEWDYYNSEKSSYLTFTEALPSVYYFVQWLNPVAEYKFADDVAVTVDGAVSVETEIDEDGCLTVWAKFEVAPPTVIDTINIEGVFAPLYGQVPKYYLDDVIAKVKVNNEPYDSKNQAFGNLNVEWQTICDSTKTMLSSSETFSEGTYYYLLELYPKTGFVFADIDDISASVNGNASVELEASTVYDDTVLVWVKLEVECPHAYDNACDATCNKCESTRTPAAHKGGTATCTDKAKCSVCGEAYSSLKAHSYKTTVSTKATLSKNGKTVEKCSCGAVKSKSEKTVYYPKTIKLEYTSTIYNGKTKTPSVTVKDSKGNKISKDYYTVKYASGRKNTGKYSVTITFKGKYSGTKTLYFNILPSKTSKITPTCSTTEIKASWKKVTGASGYKVELLNSKGKVVKKVTTTKTSYTFKKLSKVTTYKIRVTAYKTIDKKAVYSTVSTTITTSTAPAKVTLSKVTAGSKSAAVSWKTVSGASGYQVQYSTSSKFKSAKTATVSKGSSKKTTIKKLTKGKTYYFKVRAYKTVDGKKVYGAWSAVKNVKVK